MSSPTSEFISLLQNQYNKWWQTEEKTKEIECQFENVDLKIIFNKGRWIYPIANCPTPAVIENSINIAPNNEIIKKLFESFLLKNEDCYSFPTDSCNKFQMRFFTDEASIRKKLIEEEKRYAKYESPNMGLEKECTLI